MVTLQRLSYYYSANYDIYFMLFLIDRGITFRPAGRWNKSILLSHGQSRAAMTKTIPRTRGNRFIAARVIQGVSARRRRRAQKSPSHPRKP